MKNKYFIKVFSALLVSVLFLTSCGKLADDVTVKWPDGIYLEGASKDDEAHSSIKLTSTGSKTEFAILGLMVSQ